MVYSQIRQVTANALFLCIILFEAAQAQDPVLYVAVLSNKNYVVGANNAPAGLVASPDAGERWGRLCWPNCRAFDVAVVPASKGNVIYVAGGNGVLKTENGGLEWRLCTDWRITEVQDIEVSGLDSMWVTAGTAYGVFISGDGAQTWEERNHGLETLFCSALEVDAAIPEKLWVGTENGIYISRDRGMHWERTEGVSVAVRSLIQCPGEPELLLAGTEDEGVYRSEDGGMTWIPSSKGMKGVTVYDIAFDPNDPRKVYAGTHGKGVYISRNSGRSWRNLSEGLVNRVVHSVCVWPLKDDPRVFAGTVNGGIYQWDPDQKKWVFSGLDGAQVWEIEVHRFREER